MHSGPCYNNTSVSVFIDIKYYIISTSFGSYSHVIIHRNETQEWNHFTDITNSVTDRWCVCVFISVCVCVCVKPLQTHKENKKTSSITEQRRSVWSDAAVTHRDLHGNPLFIMTLTPRTRGADTRLRLSCQTQ